MASYTFLDYDMTWFSKVNSGPGKDWPIKAGDPVVGSRNWRGGFSCVIVELSTMIMVLGLYKANVLDLQSEVLSLNQNFYTDVLWNHAYNSMLIIKRNDLEPAA